MKNYLIIGMIFFTNMLTAQSTFQNQLKLLKYNIPGPFVELSNGDIVIQGITANIGNTVYEFFTRIDSNGNIVWDRLFSNPSNYYIQSKYIWLDSNNIIHSIGTYCTDIDLNGNVINRKAISYPVIGAQPYGNGYIATNNNFIYEIDSTYNLASSAIKFDINSIPLGNYSERGLKITSDNGYVYYGRITKTISQTSESKLFLIKLDSLLQMQWYKIYQSSLPADSTFALEDLIQTTAGDYIISLRRESPFSYLYLIKLDSGGDFKWGKSIPCTGNNGYYLNLTEDVSLGNYLMTLNFGSSLAQKMINVIRTDTAFNVLSAYNYTNNTSNYIGDDFSETFPLSNGQYLIKSIKWDSTQAHDVLLIKTNSNLLSGCTDTAITIQNTPYELVPTTDTVTVSIIPLFVTSAPAPIFWLSSASIQVQCQSTGHIEELFDPEINVYPNPFTSYFKISIRNYKFAELSFIIRNVYGQVIYKSKYYSNNSDISIDMNLDGISNGIYFLHFNIDNTSIIRRISKL